MYNKYVAKYALVSLTLYVSIFVLLYLLSNNLEVRGVQMVDNLIFYYFCLFYYYSCFITPIMNVVLLLMSFIKKVSPQRLMCRTIFYLLLSLIYPLLGVYVYLNFVMSGII